MIKGLEKFKRHFSAYSDSYVLIGGVACAVAMEEVGLEFRATKDLDIVLYVETLDLNFMSAFWNFIREGGYENKQRSTGKNLFYRFDSPINDDFPAMLELFSRIPDSVHFEGSGHLTPIPANGSIMSLSAILLDDNYYYFTHSGKQDIGGISIVKASHLIPLKSRAWLDLMDAKQSGEIVDQKNIKKHKNDVMRLSRLLTPANRISIPEAISEDMKKFLDRISQEPIDLKTIGIREVSFEEVIQNLIEIYNL